MLNNIEQKLQNVLGQFIFEENNYITQQNVLRSIRSFLSGMVTRREIKTFDISYDDYRSTDESLYVEVSITPLQRIDTILINLSLQKHP